MSLLNRRQRQDAIPLRTSIGLFAVLLLAIVAIAGFTIQLLKAERKALEETEREVEARHVELLSDHVEQTVINSIQTPLLALRNMPVDDINDELLGTVTGSFAELKQTAYLDAKLTIRKVFPAEGRAAIQKQNDWLAQKIATLARTRGVDKLGRGEFLDNLDGVPYLFLFEPLREDSPDAGYLLLRFDVNALTAQRLQPLLDEFSRGHEGVVSLQDPQMPWDDAALNWPVGHVMPGWLLSFKRDASAEDRRVEREQHLVLGITGGLILAMIMATFAVWRELSRERALVALRNQFVANVSHELRTPLALIRMYAETLALKRLSDPDKIHHYHRTILRETERLTKMIEKVLDFARIKGGGQLYRLEHFDLATTVHDVVENYEQQIAEQGIQLTLSLADDVPRVAHDRDGITQVMINLLDNAVKYGQGSPVQVSLQPVSAGVELTVSDQGPGIPLAEREQMRKPFQRGAQAQPMEGSGLGLYLVDQIVKTHHGHFYLEPAERGAGLKARVVLPRERSVKP